MYKGYACLQQLYNTVLLFVHHNSSVYATMNYDDPKLDILDCSLYNYIIDNDTSIVQELDRLHHDAHREAIQSVDEYSSVVLVALASFLYPIHYRDILVQIPHSQADLLAYAFHIAQTNNTRLSRIVEMNAIERYIRIVNILRPLVDFNSVDPVHGFTIMNIAVRLGNEEAIQHLLLLGVSRDVPESTYNNHFSLLMRSSSIPSPRNHSAVRAFFNNNKDHLTEAQSIIELMHHLMHTNLSNTYNQYRFEELCQSVNLNSVYCMTMQNAHYMSCCERVEAFELLMKHGLRLNRTNLMSASWCFNESLLHHLSWRGYGMELVYGLRSRINRLVIRENTSLYDIKRISMHHEDPKQLQKKLELIKKRECVQEMHQGWKRSCRQTLEKTRLPTDLTNYIMSYL